MGPAMVVVAGYTAVVAGTSVVAVATKYIVRNQRRRNQVQTDNIENDRIDVISSTSSLQIEQS